MKSNRLSNNSNTTQFRRNAVAFGVALAIASSAYANPNGMSVVAGQATAQTIGNLMQITNSPGAILNWQQFNIDVGQTTQFIQQNAASQVFNRVTGGDVSQILGTLQSNGQVFLINPAGVFFGQGAVVDTAGFLASTLAASNTDLLNGHLKFSDPNGTAGGIVNQGSLTTHSGGSIVLLAPSIENSGIIHAQGEVLLAAGHSVTIVDMNHPTIGLTVAAKAGEKAVNLGQIISKNASLFSHLVNNSGVVEATGAQLGEGGVIRFIAQGDALVSGQVLAESTSGKGGEIDITGNRVAVLDGARISADGGAGGGTVHIGGGWQGQDATLANSQQTIVQANTEISANAIDNGNGGEVVVWADGHTTVNSEIQAKGGALGGNGGRVETSGKESLAANVAANTSAANGEAGQWLLDPANLTIVSDADFQAPAPITFVNQNDELIFSTDNIDPSTSPTESFLRASTVVQGLQTNGIVVIQTTGQSPGEGNLTVAAPILVGSGLTTSQFNLLNLDLIVKGEINIDAPMGLAPGQTVFNGFNLSLDYDLAKPVYIDAPLYLGTTGSLNLFPYDTGAVVQVASTGGLPLSGVNFLSGMNDGVTGPLVIPQIILFTPSSVLSETQNLDLNFLGSNLQVGNVFTNSGGLNTFTNVRLGADTVDLPAPVNAQLSYSLISARTLTLDSGSVLSQIPQENFSTSSDFETVTINGGSFNLGTGSAEFRTVNLNSGALNLNDTFAVINTLNSESLSLFSLNGAFAAINEANLNGDTSLLTGVQGFGSALLIEDLDLNGTLVSTGNGQPSSTHSIDIRALGMGSNSIIQLGQGDVLSLGKSTSFFDLPIENLPKQEGTIVSSTGGQFAAQLGARIVMNGSPTPLPEGPIISQPVEMIDTASSSSFGITVLDVTGLDGAINTPIRIQVNGFGHIIQTDSSVFSPLTEQTTFIDALNIGDAVNITVNGGGANKTLLLGGSQFSESSQFSSVDVNFEGTLNVNSGFVRLEGGLVSTTNGTLNVNGSNSLIELAGEFTSADLFAINRSNGGALSATGLWNNSAVNAGNLMTTSPLLKGNILIGDDLTIAGGVLSSAGTSNALNVAPYGFLELRDTDVSTTINLAPTSVLLLASQDETGAAVGPVVLNDAKINMGGDAFLVVEADELGNATLDGTATISSGTQGNLILAGRRSYEFIDPLLQPPLIPDVMNFSVGPNIRLNVTGNAPSLPEALSFYYSQLSITNIPERPVFLVGQLTPQAVAINEYENFFSPATTILTGFANDTFIIDGFADFSTENSANCSVIDFCVKFDVAQNLTYSGLVMTSLGAPNSTLANSGVAFVSGANLSGLQFAVQTPDTIQFMQGLNIVTATDLASGKTLVNGPSSVVRLGSNLGNETITNNLQNDGLLELQGFYTLSGLLGGSGTISNSGTLVLSNGTGSLITNSIVNSGTITNTGSYSLNGLSSVGAASFFNTGTLSFNQGLYTFGTGGYVQTAGNLIVQPGSTLAGNININGGALRGFANISGNLNAQGGRIIPGASPGLTTVSGDLNLDSASVIDIEIQSDDGVQGVDFDCIVVQGTANLAGQLNLIDISGGTLTTGSEYAFLEASAINGAFSSVNASSASLTYSFSAPELGTSSSQVPQLLTRTIAATSTPLLTTTTGSTDSAVSQNLTQAFVPTSTTTTTQPTSTTPQQEQEAVEVANQSTGGATVSQQSSSIELQSTPSDPQRASAVCK
jgi:filamentous hemagglutinin family protein